MQLSRSYHAKRADEQKLSYLGSINPAWALPLERVQFSPPYLHQVGITYDAPVVGKGYIKLYYRDFIVEEISADGEVVPTNTARNFSDDELTVKRPKVRATLIKQGMATQEATERLAEALSVPVQSIGYAGLKDGRALTSQDISFNGPTVEEVRAIKLGNLTLRDIYSSNEIVSAGQLQGNRFTILVRCAPEAAERVRQGISVLLADGVPNFYSLQRFGSRLAAHKIGRLLIQQQYEAAVREYLIGKSPYETFTLQNFREEAGSHWGQWEQMAATFSELPYFFYYELVMLQALQQKPRDFAGAFAAIPEQAKMMVYAYTSYYYNLLLSSRVQRGNVTPELPILRADPEVQRIYREVVSDEELHAARFYHPDLPFLQLNKPQSVGSYLRPTIHQVVPLEHGVLLHFDLQKGAYATTLLAHLFHLYQYKPVPVWVNEQLYDGKAILGVGSLDETESLLNKYSNPDTDASLLDD